jgi:hypothetical protein
MLLVIPPRPNPKNTDPGLGSIPFIKLLIRDEMIDSCRQRILSGSLPTLDGNRVRVIHAWS